ncbi:MAG TPA: thrombospondin type 3 repeat-containing protein, partial [bacterium]|nr:thrombospondin type 3 repeat-containing protein [bacterium]
MKSVMKKVLSVAAFALVLGAGASRADAAWGEIYCDISNGSSSALKLAVDLYNSGNTNDDTDDSKRQCKKAVRFYAEQTIPVPSGFLVYNTPPDGATYGLAFRKCVSTGPNAEAGCPSLSDTAVVLDASGKGDCPIKVSNGAKIDFIKFKLIVDNTAKAICTEGGQNIEPENMESNYAWIHDVTICSASDPNCTGTPSETDCSDGVDNDGDGKTDCEDTDCSSNPGACPQTEENCSDGVDNDNDGKIDCEDTDCADDTAHCSGTEDCDDHVDNDGDGKVDCDDSDCSTNPACSNPDDSDGDGIPDATDKCDKDSTGNVCDSTDLAACFSNASDNVCSGVGVGDAAACSETEDMDNDGRGNRCDEDIDGDGLKNGSDPDPYDPDADNDGACDGPNMVGGCSSVNDPCPLLNGVVKNSLGQCAPEPVSPGETDPDGDGLTTTLETEIGTNPNDDDSDDDGAKDGVDCFPLDAAKQNCGGATTIVDPDFDDDGICNGAESGTDPVTGNPCTPNAAGQGDNCPATPNPDQKDDNHNNVGDACEIGTSLDGDGDGLPDDLEESVFHTDPTKPDTDGDGLSDSDEVNGPTYQNGEGPLNPDVDDDGICDGPATVSDDAGEICNAGPNGTGDNCPIVKNADQSDADGNGRGDVCDGDMDGDGIADADDDCPFISDPLQPDSNEDGVGDACDPNLAVSGIDGGCGCRMDGKSGGRAQDLIPFAALMIPLALLRI